MSTFMIEFNFIEFLRILVTIFELDIRKNMKEIYSYHVINFILPVLENETDE